MKKAFVFLINKLKKLLPERAIGTAGKWGEEEAVRFLKNKGYKIIARNVRFGHREELDIVASWRDVLVFLEVKTRSSEKFASPIAAVNRKKRHLLARAAIRYIKRLHTVTPNFRFDIIEVIGSEGSLEPAIIRHIENAFVLDNCYFVPDKLAKANR
jgi:putative endonuclease